MELSKTELGIDMLPVDTFLMGTKKVEGIL
jgi:hypothetical protein